MPVHIKRLVLTFAVFIGLFLIMQHILKPRSFGELGHYRSNSIHENASKELHYAGFDKCFNCHESQHLEKKEGYHAPLKCELCHGPASKHVRYAEKVTVGGALPDSLKLFKPTERKDCALCHQKNAARTKILFDTIDNTIIRQIDAFKHKLLNKKTKAENKCIDCHNPHQP